MKCPYCNSKNFIPEVVMKHTESYGSNIHHFRCTKCDKVVKGKFKVKVLVEFIQISDRKEGDWG